MKMAWIKEIVCGVALIGSTCLPGLAQTAGDLTLFSATSQQSDYQEMFDPHFLNHWKEVAPAFDAFNIHAAYFFHHPEQVDKIHTMLSHPDVGKNMAIEIQTGQGLHTLGLTGTGPCVTQNDNNWAFECGKMAADAIFYGGTDVPGLVSFKKPSGSQVEYLLIDSAFYVPYMQLGYFNSNLDGHSAQNKFKAVSFMDGFIQRIKSETHFGQNLKIVLISHIKYEYVGTTPGMKNRHNGLNCYNTCMGGIPWTNEKETLEYIITHLPSRIDWVFFDISWSYLYGNEAALAAWDEMVNHIHDLGVGVGNIVHTDGPAGSVCSNPNANGDMVEHQECWFHEFFDNLISTCSPAEVAESAEWNVHVMSMLETVFGNNSILPSASKVSGTMIATWHKYPASVFGGTGAGCVSLSDILKCSGSLAGRGTTCT